MRPDDKSSERERIAAQLRASIRKARVPGTRSARGFAFHDDGSIEHDLILLRSSYDVAHAPFTSHRPLVGRAIIFIKNIVRELVVQLFERQTSFNGAAARAIDHLNRKLEAMAQEHKRIEQRLDALEASLPAQAHLRPQSPDAESVADQPDAMGSGWRNRRAGADDDPAARPRRGLPNRA